MQASKIVIGKLYAVSGNSGALRRFRPTAVTTTRTTNHNNPHDYKSTVTGHMESLTEGEPNEQITIDPKLIEGEFEQFKELVARQKMEEKAREERKEREAAAALELATLLHRLTGQELPDDTSSHRAPFRTGYSAGVEINREGVALLLPYLKTLKA